MKSIVETTGAFQLICPDGQFVPFDTVGLISENAFWANRISSGQVRVLGVVNDDATDAELILTMAACGDDQALGVASFLSQYPVAGAVTDEALVAALAAKKELAEKQAADAAALAAAEEEAAKKASEKEAARLAKAAEKK